MTGAETDNQNSNAARLCLLVLIPIIGIGGTAAVSFIRLFSLKEIILNTAVAAAVCIAAEIPLERAKIDRYRARYFVTSYLAGLIMAVFSGFIFEFALPMASCAVVIGMLNGELLGISALIMFSGISTLVLYESGLYFFYMLFTGFILIMLFNGRERAKVIPSVITYVSISAVTYVSCVFLSSAAISPELVVFPIVGVISNIIVTVIMLPKVFENVLERRDRFFLKINDPEYDLLQELKRENKREYDKTIHIAHLADILSETMNLKKRKVMGICYYHRIGVLRGDNDNVDIKSLSLIREREFPKEIIDGIQEYYGMNGKRLTRESATVLITDTFVSMIYDHKDENEGKGPDYDKLVSALVKDSMRDKRFQYSDLSLNDFNVIYEKLKKEKLYYDFLL